MLADSWDWVEICWRVMQVQREQFPAGVVLVEWGQPPRAVSADKPVRDKEEVEEWLEKAKKLASAFPGSFNCKV